VDTSFLLINDIICQQLTAEGAAPSTIDGVRVSRSSGWWLLRASNTQAALVARCEASSPEGLEVLKDELAFYLAPHGLKI
jgi:phosphomannomutase